MPIPALDHLVVDVTNTGLDAAAAVFRDLGFQLTARGQHSLGSSNHLAMFSTNYLELLSAGSQPVRQELVDFTDGMNGLVLVTPAATAQHRDVVARGIAARDPQSFSRPVTLADGSTQDARFRTVHLLRSEVPFGRLYFCQHDTRDLVWRPEWQRHPNGAEDVTGVTISADDPATVTQLFRRLFDTAGETLVAGTVPLEVLTHAEAASRFGTALPQANGRASFIAAVRVRTASLATTAGVLGARATVLASGCLRVLACNVVVEFVE